MLIYSARLRPRWPLIWLEKKPTDGAIKWNKGPKGIELDAKLLPVERIDATNLQKTVDVGWATKDKICAGVSANPPSLCK